MKKLVLFVFSALAIHAVLAKYEDRDVMHNKRYYLDEGLNWNIGSGSDVNQYLMELKTINKDFIDRLQNFKSRDKQSCVKTLTWQFEFLRQYFHSMIVRLKAHMRNHKENVVEEFYFGIKQILMNLNRYHPVGLHQLKRSIKFSIQKYVQLMEKFVPFTKRNMIFAVKYVLTHFVTIIINFNYQLKNFGQSAHTTWVHITVDISKETNKLIEFLQGCDLNRKYYLIETLNQYLRIIQLEFLKNKKLLENISDDRHIILRFQKICKKMCNIVKRLKLTVESDIHVDIEVWKQELITVLKTISADISKLVVEIENKYKGTERYWIIEKFLRIYLSIIKKLKTDLLKDEEVTTVTKPHVNEITSFIQVLAGQLHDTLKNLFENIKTFNIDNATAKQTLIFLFREYILNLETVVDKLDEVYKRIPNQFGKEMKAIMLNFRVIISALKEIVNVNKSKDNMYLHLQNFFENLEKLFMLLGTKFSPNRDTNLILKDLLVHILTVTRNFNVYLRSIGNVIPKGEIYVDILFQIQIHARNYIINVNSLTRENVLTIDAILAACQEYSILVQHIIASLESKFVQEKLHHDKAFYKVIRNLKIIVGILDDVITLKPVSFCKIRKVLSTCVESTVSEMDILLSIWRRHGIEQELKTRLYNIFYDYIIFLQYEQHKLYITYTKRHFGEDIMHQLVAQIKIITNNLDSYFEKVNKYNKENKGRFVYVLEHDLIASLNLIIRRLETEVISEDKSGIYWRVINQFKFAVDRIRVIVKNGSLGSAYNIYAELKLALKDINEIFEQLTNISKRKEYKNVEQVVINSLLQYVVTIRNLQVQFIKIHYNHQLGKTRIQLFETIENISKRIQGLIRFLVLNSEDDLSLIVYVRNLYTSLGRILDQLNANRERCRRYRHIRELTVNIIKLRSYIERYIFNVDQIKPQQLQINIRFIIVEIRNIFWIVQYACRNNLQDYKIILKPALDNFVIQLEYFVNHLQIILPFVSGRLTIEEIYQQIEVTTGRLEALLHVGVWRTADFRKIILEQIERFYLTIDDLMLKAQKYLTGKKNLLGHNARFELKAIHGNLVKITTSKTVILPKDLTREFLLTIRKISMSIHSMEYGFLILGGGQQTEKIVVFTDILMRYLAALKCMYVRLENTTQPGKVITTSYLLGKIGIALQELISSLTSTTLNTDNIKLYIRLYNNFIHHIHGITYKLEALINSKKFTSTILRKALLNIKRIVTHTKLMLETSNNLSNKQLLHLVTSAITTIHLELIELRSIRGVKIGTEITDILIDFYEIVAIYKEHIKSIPNKDVKNKMFDKLIDYVETLVSRIYSYLHLNFKSKLITQTILDEFRKTYEIVDIIIKKLGSAGESTKDIIIELKAIQVNVSIYITKTYTDVDQLNIEFNLYLRRVMHNFKKLVSSLLTKYKGIINIPSNITYNVKMALLEFIDSIYNTLIIFSKISIESGKIPLVPGIEPPIEKNCTEIVTAITPIFIEFVTATIKKVTNTGEIYKEIILKIIAVVESLQQKLKLLKPYAIWNRIIKILGQITSSLKLEIVSKILTPTELITKLNRFLIIVLQQLKIAVKIGQGNIGNADKKLIHAIKIVIEVLQKLKNLFYVCDDSSENNPCQQLKDFINLLDKIIPILKVASNQKDDILEQVYRNLTISRNSIHKLIHLNVAFTIYQIKDQFQSYIQWSTDNLLKLLTNSKEYFKGSTFAYGILCQYFCELHDIYRNWEQNFKNFTTSHYLELMQRKPHEILPKLT